MEVLKNIQKHLTRYCKDNKIKVFKSKKAKEIPFIYIKENKIMKPNIFELYDYKKGRIFAIQRWTLERGIVFEIKPDPQLSVSIDENGNFKHLRLLKHHKSLKICDYFEAEIENNKLINLQPHENRKRN
jgi:hypothetical protein